MGLDGSCVHNKYLFIICKKAKTAIENTVKNVFLVLQVLCSAWKDDGTVVFSGGCDRQVKAWPLMAGAQPITVAMHDAPVKEVAWISQMNLLVSSSWDKTIRFPHLLFLILFYFFIGNHEIYIVEPSFYHFICIMLKLLYPIALFLYLQICSENKSKKRKKKGFWRGVFYLPDLLA